MGECHVCHTQSRTISDALGVCAGCILDDAPEARSRAEAAHARSRRAFGLPEQPPRDDGGLRCDRCVNACSIAPGRAGYCGVRSNDGGRLVGGDADGAAVEWYYDPLPTNCVADWVCPASGAERGYSNLAVFYEACTFDCLFCQNWHFKSETFGGRRRSAVELADAVTERTRCMCFFGGDPSCQVVHALAAARLARGRRGDRILRICWETNGSVSRRYLDEMAALSLESGGCIKFDLKAWDEPLHRALCGVTNKRTLSNFEHLASYITRRPDPPFLVASTLLVPGYVDADQVGKIARFIAALDDGLLVHGLPVHAIPYALLAFHPSFEMRDLPTTSREQADACLAAAQDAGLTRVRIGNVHLLT